MSSAISAVSALRPPHASPPFPPVAALLAFGTAGALPLLPNGLPALRPGQFSWAVCLAFLALFSVGALRSVVTVDRWWRAGLEMLVLGALVAAAAYGAGALIASMIA